MYTYEYKEVKPWFLRFAAKNDPDMPSIQPPLDLFDTPLPFLFGSLFGCLIASLAE